MVSVGAVGLSSVCTHIKTLITRTKRQYSSPVITRTALAVAQPAIRESRIQSQPVAPGRIDTAAWCMRWWTVPCCAEYERAVPGSECEPGRPSSESWHQSSCALRSIARGRIPPRHPPVYPSRCLVTSLWMRHPRCSVSRSTKLAQPAQCALSRCMAQMCNKMLTGAHTRCRAQVPICICCSPRNGLPCPTRPI